jgi:hypothetical protein
VGLPTYRPATKEHQLPTFTYQYQEWVGDGWQPIPDQPGRAPRRGTVEAATAQDAAVQMAHAFPVGYRVVIVVGTRTLAAQRTTG